MCFTTILRKVGPVYPEAAADRVGCSGRKVGLGLISGQGERDNPVCESEKHLEF